MKATLIPVAQTNIGTSIQETLSSRMKAQYLEAQREKKVAAIKRPPVEKAQTLRERILGMSLFPDIYNKDYLQRHG